MHRYHRSVILYVIFCMDKHHSTNEDPLATILGVVDVPSFIPQMRLSQSRLHKGGLHGCTVSSYLLLKLLEEAIDFLVYFASILL